MYFTIILEVLGGLSLFLYAVISLSKHIQNLLGERAKYWLSRFTHTLIQSVLFGGIITVLLDSSSAVIIVTIILVNSGQLKLRQAMGIVLGANIGTTIGSQIIAMDLSYFAPIFLTLGFLFMLLNINSKITQISKGVFYFGLLFFGLYIIEQAVSPLKQDPDVVSLLTNATNPLHGVALVTIVTLIIQSSSATVGLTIVLAKQGLMNYLIGVAIMIGAELGTCADTLLATIKGSKATLKTGIFHVFFNVVCIILGIVFFDSFIELVELLSVDKSLEHKIANAHLLFNTLGVVIFIGFIPIIEKLLNRLLPDAKPKEQPLG